MTSLRFLAAGLAGLVLATSASAGGGAEHAHAPEGGWSFEGITGKIDRPAMQRGYQVYKQVCSSCHSMDLLSYRNLGDKGGPFYDPEFKNPNESPFVKALAADNQVTYINDAGDEDFRPARPADRFRGPYVNDAKGRAANNGALPPDLSVITKARHGGASYVYSLLLGYPDASAFVQRERPATQAELNADKAAAKLAEDDWTKKEVELLAAGQPGQAPFVAPAPKKYFDTVIDVSKLGGHGEGSEHAAKGYLVQPANQYFNRYYPGDSTPNFEGDPRKSPLGGFFAMKDPLESQLGTFAYTDGTPATREQMAKDVATFLAWAGDPKAEARKSLGLPVMIFLSILTILLWFSYKQIWRRVEH